MNFKSPLLAVTNMETSIEFYKRVLGLDVLQDFGANVTLAGGVCLQTLDTWQEFIDGRPVVWNGNAGELYLKRKISTPLPKGWENWALNMSIR